MQSFPPPAPAIFSAEGRLRRHRSRRRVVEAFRSPAMVSGFRRRPLCLARVKPPWRTSHTVLTPLPHARTRPQDNPHQHSGHQRGAPGCRPAAIYRRCREEEPIDQHEDREQSCKEARAPGHAPRPPRMGTVCAFPGCPFFQFRQVFSPLRPRFCGWRGVLRRSGRNVPHGSCCLQPTTAAPELWHNREAPPGKEC